MMTAQPAIILISGYLGSGKTTLLREIVPQLGDRRVGLVVNEFGPLGFDGAILAESGPGALVELSEGCLCCAAGSNFILAIEDLIDFAQPELILVEASGLADPVALVHRLRQADLKLAAIVALADASNLAAALERSPTAQRQLRAADFILLSKTDLLDEAEITAAESLVRAENGRAAIHPIVHGQLDATLLLGITAAVPAEMTPQPEHLAAEQAEYWHWQHDEPLDYETLLATLHELPAAIYRVKGQVCCTNAPWGLRLNIVCGRIDEENVRLGSLPSPLNQLVFIGAAVQQHANQLRERLNACQANLARASAWRDRYAEAGK